MRFYQAWTFEQRLYYSRCRAVGRPGAERSFFHSYQGDLAIFQGLHPFHFLHYGDCAVQVGCHDQYLELGVSHPLIMRAIVGESGQVVVIEPTEQNVRALLRYVGENDLHNISVAQVGLGFKIGWERFLEASDFSSSNMSLTTLQTSWPSLAERWGQDRLDLMAQRRVPIDTLAHVLQLQPSPSFVNLTCNGAEKAILEGAFPTLARMRAMKPVLAFPLANVGLPFLLELEAIGYHIAVADAPHRPWDKEQFFYACAIPVGQLDRLGLTSKKFMPAEIAMIGLRDGLPTFAATPFSAQFLSDWELVGRLAARSATYVRMQRCFQGMPSLAFPGMAQADGAPDDDIEWKLARRRGLGEAIQLESERILELDGFVDIISGETVDPKS